jgi:exonuclease SbcD
VKLLHTSDWHVGKTLRGRSRLTEQEQVLRELVTLAREHQVDAVLIAGDVYDTAAPSAEAINLVVRALMGFRDSGAEVIVIAGNHDHARAFDAYRPLFAAGQVTMVGAPRTAQDGGVISFTARSTGEPATVAVLPFLSQRYAARAAEIFTQSPAETNAQYDEMVRRILTSLAGGFQPDAVNIVMAHLTVQGGAWGGGEREAQSIFDYVVHPAAFPANAHYVALGHLHRRQHLPAPCPAVHYCGSPLNMDFGEEDNPSVALLVEVSPTTPARVTELPITSAGRLRTVTGTVDQLVARSASGEFGEDLLRVVVTEASYAGLREVVLEALPNALEVRIDPAFQKQRRGPKTASEAGLDRQPSELFAQFLLERGQDGDPRVPALFSALLDLAGDSSATDDAGVHDEIALPTLRTTDDSPDVTADDSAAEKTVDGTGSDPVPTLELSAPENVPLRPKQPKTRRKSPTPTTSNVHTVEAAPSAVDVPTV